MGSVHSNGDRKLWTAASNLKMNCVAEHMEHSSPVNALGGDDDNLSGEQAVRIEVLVTDNCTSLAGVRPENWGSWKCRGCRAQA